MSNIPADPVSETEIRLGRVLAAAVAPNEASFFDDVVAAASYPAKRRKDHTLGFGIEVGNIGAISAAVLVLCKPVLAFVWENARDAAGQMIKGASEQVRAAFQKRIDEWIERRLRKPAPMEVPREKLDAFIESVRQQSIILGLEPDASARLVAALRECFK